MGQTIQVVGLDPSLRNWGICKATLDLTALKLTVHEVDTVQPTKLTGKQVRQNSTDIDAATQLSIGAQAAIKGAQAVFIEVPVGSQSARAMASYGICVGVLGGLRAGGGAFFELTPKEVKVAATGKGTATKSEMIAWATKHHPEANWPTYMRKGEILISEGTAEHQADALGAIYAGIQLPEFQRLITFMKAA